MGHDRRGHGGFAARLESTGTGMRRLLGFGERVGELGGQPRVKSSVSTVIPGEI
jgi:hypothetical protein